MSETDPSQVTVVLERWRDGDDAAAHDLLPLVERELRRLARLHMDGERRGHLLQTTALVNEAYIRLLDARQVRWRDRTHFFAMVSRLMRRVLVDVARAQKSLKRGGALRQVTFDPDLPVAGERTEGRPRRRCRAEGAPRRASAARSGRRAPILRRPQCGRNRQDPRRLRGNRASRLAVRQALAARRTVTRREDPPTAATG